MLNMPNLVTQWLAPDRVRDFAERVAGRSRLAVWQRVFERLPKLRPTEARGYLRSRAIAVVRAETSQLIEQEGARVLRHREAIEATALQNLIDTILAQIDQEQRQTRGRRAA